MSSILGWAGDYPEMVVSVFSALIALTSAVIALGETRRQRKLLEEELRAQIDTSSLAWGNEVIEAMGEAAELATATYLSVSEQQARRADIGRRLSALVDRGRLFFPNVDAESHGTDREVAYRGKRPPILDALLYACYETQRIGEDGVRGADSANFISRCRRLVVSELQRHLDPRRLDEVIERYTDRALGAREAAMDAAGELGVILDARRPGLLTTKQDKGWTDLIDAERRRALLHDIQTKRSGAA